MNIDFDAVEFREDAWSHFSKEQQPSSSYHKAIFSPADIAEGFSKQAYLKKSFSSLDHKVGHVFNTGHGKAGVIEKDVSVEGGVSASWGGPEGVSFSWYTEVSGKDDHGNSGKATFENKDDGTKTLEVSGKHDSKDDSSSSSTSKK